MTQVKVELAILLRQEWNWLYDSGKSGTGYMTPVRENVTGYMTVVRVELPT